MRNKAISAIPWPPLAILPGWEARSEQLRRLGIIGAGELLDANSTKVAGALGVTVDVIEAWKDEAMTASASAIRTKRKGCSRRRK